ncbi:MAG: hypothetical protein WAT79_08360 [Saprospiraceae bacterium]
MKRCKRKSDLKEYRFFVFGVYDSSEIVDIGYYDLPVGYFVLVDKDVPVVLCWMPEKEFNEKYVVDGGVVDPVEELKKCRYKYNDTNIYNYLVYGENPERDKLLLIDAVFPFGTYVVFKNDGPEGYFPEHFIFNFDLINDIEHVACPPEIGNDFSNNLGECTSRKFPNDTIFEYIIYDKNSKWYPKWFPNKLKDHFIEHFNLKDGDFFVNPRGMVRCSNNFKIEKFNELFEITRPYVPCIFEDRIVEPGSSWDITSLSAERMVPDLNQNPKYAGPGGLGVCRLRNSSKNNARQWFYYSPGMTVFPKWFKLEDFNEKDIRFYNFFVYDWDSKKVSQYAHENFHENYIVVKGCISPFYGVFVEGKDNVEEECVYVNPLDVNIWFYGLPAKVMKYVLQKHGMKEGVFDIQKIYKLENGIK